MVFKGFTHPLMQKTHICDSTKKTFTITDSVQFFDQPDKKFTDKQHGLVKDEFYGDNP